MVRERFAEPQRVLHWLMAICILWDAHHYLAFCFFALILLHVAAALAHVFIYRDRIMQRMLAG